MAAGDLVLQQVSRLEDDGSTTYAWKVEGSVNPMAEELIWQAEGSSDPVGYEPYYMAVATSGTRGKVGTGQWAQCYICRYDYPISQMKKHHGRYYCIPQKCYEDIL